MIFMIYFPGTANKLCNTNWELFHKDHQADMEVTLKNGANEERVLLIKSFAKKDSSDNNEYLICTATDITELKELKTN